MSQWKPFAGQRVRMTQEARQKFRNYRSFTGVVKRLEGQLLLIDRDGIRNTGYPWHPDFWEPIPPGDMTLDETCQQLVAAYLAGDKTAALALADRIFELQG